MCNPTSTTPQQHVGDIDQEPGSANLSLVRTLFQLLVEDREHSEEYIDLLKKLRRSRNAAITAAATTDTLILNLMTKLGQPKGFQMKRMEVIIKQQRFADTEEVGFDTL